MSANAGRRIEAVGLWVAPIVLIAVTAASGGPAESNDSRGLDLQGLQITRAGDDGKIAVRNDNLGVNRAFYIPASWGAGTPALLKAHLSGGSTVTVALRMFQKIPNDKGRWEYDWVRTDQQPLGSYQIANNNGVVTGTITVRFDKTYYDGSWSYQIKDHRLTFLDIILGGSDGGQDSRNSGRITKTTQTVHQLVNWMILDYGSREPGGIQPNVAIENPETRDGDYRTMAVMVDGKYVALVSSQDGVYDNDGKLRGATAARMRMGLRNNSIALGLTPDDAPISDGRAVGTLASAAWNSTNFGFLGVDGACFQVSPSADEPTKAEIRLAATTAKQLARKMLPGKGMSLLAGFIGGDEAPPAPLDCFEPNGSIPKPVSKRPTDGK